jgi:predicted MFS family arabinose efflux permease
LLILVLLAFVAANLVAAVAPGYWTLVGARVLLVLAAGLYVPNANALAGVLAGPAHRGRSLGIVNGGITVAIAIGVPLGAFVGAHVGWRATFVGVAVMSAAAGGVLALLLPDEIAGAPPAGLRTRLAVALAPGALATLLTTTAWGTAAYAVYTYVAPYLTEIVGVVPSGIGGVLALYGVAALVGVTLGGRGNDRFGARRVQAVALPLLAASFAVMTLTALLRPPHALWVVLPLVVVWGISAWAFFPAQQSRLIGVVGVANTPVILSLNASFMYLGFALGAGLGSVIIVSSSITWIGGAGALSVVGAMALSRFAWRQSDVVLSVPTSR